MELTRQQGPLRRMLGRTVLGLAATVATLAFLAPTPIAVADPQSDAVGAIDAAWTAAGGDTSPLGAKDGDVYPVGPGFAQNFAGGAIFFTPDTGARIVTGAILDKYRSLGGPDGSDLGFPNMDEGPGRVSPDSRNVTFSAADKPVIFWTPDTGAWVVRGPINAAWDALGGSAGALGVPTADETYDGDVISQTFTGGRLSYDGRSQKFTSDPPDLAGQLTDVTVPGDGTTAINAAYRAAGGPDGPLGAREGDQYPIGADGIGQNFAGGKIFYSPTVGAHAVTGAILEKYESAGGPAGDLGFPNAGEADGGVPDSRVSSFAAPDNPVIFWTQANGAVIVRGSMKAAWDKLGGATGALGVPVADQTGDENSVSQKFSGGQVTFDVKAGKFSTDPPNLAESLGGIEVPTPVPGTPALPAPASEKDNALAFHTWWLWWIIPLALLIVASLVTWLLMTARRRRAAALPESQFGEPTDADAAPIYGTPTDGGHWSPAVSEHDDEPHGERHDEPEDSAYLSSRPVWPGSEAPQAPPNPWSDLAGDSASATAAIGGIEHELFTHRGVDDVLDVQEVRDVDEDAPLLVDEDEDPDTVDTAPTRVQSDPDEEPSGRHAAVADAPRPGSLFEPVNPATPPPSHHRAEVMEPDIAAEEPDEEPDDDLYADYRDEASEPREAAVAPPSIHLPLADPQEAPQGYPVKGSMTKGVYVTPDSAAYDELVAEIWFASVEYAEANGFTRSER